MTQVERRRNAVESVLKKYLLSVRTTCGTFLTSDDYQSIALTALNALQSCESCRVLMGACGRTKNDFAALFHEKNGHGFGSTASVVHYLVCHQKQITKEWLDMAKKTLFDAFHSSSAYDDEIANAIYAEVVSICCIISSVEMYLYCAYSPEEPPPFTTSLLLQSSSNNDNNDEGRRAATCLKPSSYAPAMIQDAQNWLPAVESIKPNFFADNREFSSNSDRYVQDFLSTKGVAHLPMVLRAGAPWALFTLNLSALFRFTSVLDTLYFDTPGVRNLAVNVLADRSLRRDQIEVVAFAATSALDCAF